MRARLGLLFPALLALTACDNSKQNIASQRNLDSSDFSIVSQHDEFDGNTSYAEKAFTNGDGVKAQVQLRCAAAEDELMSCAAGSTCSAKAVVVLPTSDNSQPSPTFTRRERPLYLTYIAGAKYEAPFQRKDLSSGVISDGAAWFVRKDSTWYENAIEFLIPTGGSSPASKSLYRFNIVGRANPLDIAINYASPNTSQFLKTCDALEAKSGAPAPAVQQHPQTDMITSTTVNSANVGQGSTGGSNGEILPKGLAEEAELQILTESQKRILLNYLHDNPILQLATDEDCNCADDLNAARTIAPNDPYAYGKGRRYQPYLVSADLNGDGLLDMAVVMINYSAHDQSHPGELLIFAGDANGKTNPVPTYVEKDLPLQNAALSLSASPPHYLLFGLFEAEGCAYVSTPQGWNKNCSDD